MTSEFQRDKFFAPEPSDRKWTEEEFLARRELVLARWPTGAEVANIDDGVRYLASVPESKSYAATLARAKQQRHSLFEVGIGHTTFDETMDHLKAAEASGADTLLLLTDAYTRRCQYGKAGAALQRALLTGERLLNGFPLVNYGLRTREIISSLSVPVHFTGNADEEDMLTSEIALACGCSCDNSHSLHDLVQHNSTYPLGQRIQTHQYVARLAGYYEERGAPIQTLNLANFGGMIPASLGMAIAIISLLLTARQGGTYQSMHKSVEGSFVQDIAAFKVFPGLAEEYLRRFGYECRLTTASFPWMGAWPESEFAATGLLSWCTSISLIAEVDSIYLKSVHEGSGIPVKEANQASLAVAIQLRRMLEGTVFPISVEIQDEMEELRQETRQLVDAVIEIGDGDVAMGQLEAVKRGVLDVPHSSWRGVRGEVLSARDACGSIRYLSFGNLPFTAEVKRYNELKLREREQRDNVAADLNLAIADLVRYAGIPWKTKPLTGAAVTC